MTRVNPRKLLLLVEWLALFVALPLLVLYGNLGHLKLAVLMPGLIYALVVYHCSRRVPGPEGVGYPLGTFLIRIAVVAAAIVALAAVMIPEAMFNFPRRRPLFWMLA